ncbi:hypothetical protein BDW22DRAFT_1364549 [Trametopsis cervina]|nr:hypothetical protein BDW22DRAFT_1364549 [Trametopsis cervina]
MAGVANAADIAFIRHLAALSITRRASDYIFTTSSIRDRVFVYCTPGTLIILSRVCRTLRTDVDRYFEHALDINAHLSRFFDNPRAFRSLQARTGTLISGSNALQFFERTVYEGSDLDLYVVDKKVHAVAKWLMEDAGYTFVPTQASLAGNPTMTFAEAVLADTQHEHPDPVDEYTNRSGIKGLYNFEKTVQEGKAAPVRRKVQVVTAEDTAMRLILMFHSTVVMNVISYDRAYCFYPHVTFERRFTLQTRGSVPSDVKEKYISRGWAWIPDAHWGHSCSRLIKTHSRLPDRGPQPVSLHDQPRWAADRHSWVVRLPLDGVSASPTAYGDPCFATSWQLRSLCDMIGVDLPEEPDPEQEAYWQQTQCHLAISFAIIRPLKYVHTYVSSSHRLRALMEDVGLMLRRVLIDGPRRRPDDTLYVLLCCDSRV